MAPTNKKIAYIILENDILEIFSKIKSNEIEMLMTVLSYDVMTSSAEIISCEQAITITHYMYAQVILKIESA